MATKDSKKNNFAFYSTKNPYIKKGGQVYTYEVKILREYKKQLDSIRNDLVSLYKNAEDGKLTYTNANKARKLQGMLSSIKSRISKMYSVNSSRMNKGLTGHAYKAYKISRDQAIDALKITSKVEWPKINPKNMLAKPNIAGQVLKEQVVNSKVFFSDKLTWDIRRVLSRPNGSTLENLINVVTERFNGDAGRFVGIMQNKARDFISDSSTITFENLTNPKNKYYMETALGKVEVNADFLTKVWNHTEPQANPRRWHAAADKQKADEDGNFHIDGQVVSQPGMFGNARNDKYCLCYVTFEQNTEAIEDFVNGQKQG